MTKQSAAAAFDYYSSLVPARLLQLSGKGWEAGVVSPTCRASRMSVWRRVTWWGSLKQIDRWKTDLRRVNRTVSQPAPGFDAGGADLRGGTGCVLDRAGYLTQSIEGQITHLASISVERRCAARDD
jgi:hypothetical protein